MNTCRMGNQFLYTKEETGKYENYKGITLENAAYKILLNTTKPYIEKIAGDYRMDSEMEDL
jgi:hypothetical protein